MITFDQFKTDLKAQSFPAGLAENLDFALRKLMVEGLIHVQRYVKCSQENNTQVYPACSTYWDCNLTVVNAPNGNINRVYTIGPEGYCDKVAYRQIAYDRLLCSAKSLGLLNPPPMTGKPALPHPFMHHDAASDMACGRARYGFYAIHNDRVYVAPWLHSTESLVIEWNGIKREWVGDDLVQDEDDFKRAVRLYVEKEMKRSYQMDLQGAQADEAMFREALGELVYDCTMKTRVREGEICGGSDANLDSCGCPDALVATAAPDGSVVFAQIGDYRRTGNVGDPNAGTNVADLVKSWSPSFIVTVGDNIYGSADYEDQVGTLYGDYITEDLSTNRFWPALGNHDWNDAGITAWYDYFTLPNNERYYTFVRGGVQFFIMDSALTGLGATSPEPDGIAVTSIQAQWLRIMLAVSEIKWKVVIVQDPPYSTADDRPGHAILRYPFKTWGADILISGDAHAYERFEGSDGFPYIVNGFGGALKESALGAALTLETDGAATKYQYVGDYGALRCTAGCDSLLFEFYTRSGTLIDSLKLEK